MKQKLEFGWGFPILARKGHYYEEGKDICLCGKWWYTGQRYYPAMPSEVCKACTKKLIKLQGKK
jgi:hypothetical protein